MSIECRAEMGKALDGGDVKVIYGREIKDNGAEIREVYILVRVIWYWITPQPVLLLKS